MRKEGGDGERGREGTWVKGGKNELNGREKRGRKRGIGKEEEERMRNKRKCIII